MYCWFLPKQVYNNDINNPSIDDYGSLENIDTGNLGDSGGVVDQTKVTSVKVTNSPLTIPWNVLTQIHCLPGTGI